MRSLDFARDIGADLVNLHFYMDEGPAGYAAFFAAGDAAEASDLRLASRTRRIPRRTTSIRRSPSCGGCTLPGQSACAWTWDMPTFARPLTTTLSATSMPWRRAVPIIHLHMHENYGDRDSHLPLFTGPSRQDDRGVRAFLERMVQRRYRGAMILEQWPDPPTLLVEAASRLRTILAACDGASGGQSSQH